MADEHPSFLARLKQHHLYGVVVAYAVVVGFLIQLVSRAFPYFGWAGAVPAVIIVLLLGFPVVVVMAWLFIKPKDPAKSDTWQRRHWKLSAAVTMVVIVLVVVSGSYGLRFSERRAEPLAASEANATAGKSAPSINAVPSAATAIPAKSIAVLPFENLSADKNNAYFADGMQDMILAKLARIGDLKVISRTSTEQYASHPQNLTRIGEQLGVASILEGSVQKAGNQVLITVQLIDARSDNHLWAETYQRTLDNIFGVEGEVAQQVADALNVKLSGAEQQNLASVPTHNADAYDLFLRADYHQKQGYANFDVDSIRKAGTLYQQAIAKDPAFAVAYAHLADVELDLANYSSGQAQQAFMDQARSHAAHALKLQPELVDAQLAMVDVDFVRGDDAAANKLLDQAAALEPNNSHVLLEKALLERQQGDITAASAAFMRIIALEPRNLEPVNELGVMYLRAGRYVDAERWLKRALALDPHSVHVKTRYAEAILFGTGDIQRAWDTVQGDDPELMVMRVQLLALQRKYADALRLLDTIPETNNPHVEGWRVIERVKLYQRMGVPATARPQIEQDLASARQRLRNDPDSARSSLHTWLGIAWTELALDHREAALAAARKATEIESQTTPLLSEPTSRQLAMATFYAAAERADLAVPQLAAVLAPWHGGRRYAGEDYSPLMLRLDPAWDPIRKDPRFQALLKEYSPPATSATGAVIQATAVNAGSSHG